MNGWIFNGKSMFKVFVFEDWDNITDFLINLTNIIKELDHHPDILFHTASKSISVFLTTHSQNGLSEKDELMASRLDEIYKP